MSASRLNDKFKWSYSIPNCWGCFEYIKKNIKYLLTILEYKYMLTESETGLHLKLKGSWSQKIHPDSVV